MRILVLGDASPDFAAIEGAFRRGQVEFLGARSALDPAQSEDVRLSFARWTLDPVTRECFGRAGERADLTSAEFELLLAFLRRPGQAISRAELMGTLRGRVWDYFDRSIDTAVARLRKKIDAPGAPSLLRSVRGVGYVFCATVASEPGGDPENRLRAP